MNVQETMTRTRPSRVQSARTAAQAVLGRSSVDGWFIEGVGTPASTPAPGSQITIRATATNASDPDGLITVPVLVDGRQVGTMTFAAAITGVATDSIQITVPDASAFTVSVGGEATRIETSQGGDGGTTQPRVGELEFTRSLQVSQRRVRVGETFTATVEIGCTGVGPADCPTEELRVSFDGETVRSEVISGLTIPDVITRQISITPQSAGSKTVTATLDGRRQTASVTVEPAPTDDGDRAPPPGDGTTQPPRGAGPIPGLPLSLLELAIAAGGTIGTLALLVLFL